MIKEIRLFLAHLEDRDLKGAAELQRYARDKQWDNNVFIITMTGEILRKTFADPLYADTGSKVMIPVPEGIWPGTLYQCSLEDFGSVLQGEVVELHPAVIDHIAITVRCINTAVPAYNPVKVSHPRGPSLSAKPFLAAEEAVPASGSIIEAENRQAIRLEAAMASRGMGFTGDACDNCGAFAMVRTGTCNTCQECGKTGGCG